LTGGEPTIHPTFKELLNMFRSWKISLTTNGIRPISVGTWNEWKAAGLSKVIMSVHDATVQGLLNLESKTRSFGWATRAIQSQMQNLAAIVAVGMPARVNIVVYNGYRHALGVLDRVQEIPGAHQIDVRFLNDLSDPVRSNTAIDELIMEREAKPDLMIRRANTSNETISYHCPNGAAFSVKRFVRRYLPVMCDGCALKDGCLEGFYGVRLERRDGVYFVRLCIYKHSPDILMPWQDFMKSKIAQVLKI
jgi:molybdenum cofactor biosynthesis enzyme MoaA